MQNNIKRFTKRSCFFFIVCSFIYGCGESSIHTAAIDSTTTETMPIVAPVEEIKSDANTALLGIYHGVQASYNLKNQYGDDMEVNGNKIPVPSIDFKFILKEGNVVELQQINLEDNSRVYYNGKFNVLTNDGNSIKISCSLSDGKSSTPTYNLLINNNSNTITCIGNNEPEFSVEKNNSTATATNSTDKSSSAASENADREIQQNINGVYTFKDESVVVQIVINGDSWTGKTTIITGMGDDYDKPEYESGVVNGNDLYESTGLVKIGYVNGRNLTTTIGDSRVTLSK